MNQTKRVAFLCVAAASAVTIAGCSSSASNPASTAATPVAVGTPPSSTPASSGATTTASSCTGTPATGAPLKFGSIISVTGPSPFSDVKQGLEAAVSCLNARGGLDGRPMSLDICDDQAVPANADACAKSFKGMVAVVGGIGLGVTQSTFSILASEGLPVIGQVPLGTADYTAPNSFPLTGGVIGQGAAIGAELAKKGTKSVKVMSLSVPGGEVAGQTVCNSYAKLLPSGDCKTVPVDIAASSLDPNVAAATAGGTPGSIVGMVNNPQCPSLQTAIQNAGVNTTEYYTGSCLTTGLIGQAGSAATNSIYSTEMLSPLVPANASNPDVALFIAALKQYAPSADYSQTVQTNFAAPFFVAEAAKSIGADKLTGATLTSWIKAARDQHVLGATATYTFGSQGSQTPQLGQASVQFVQRTGSSYASVGTPVDGLG
jgi:branched-chain amino acid transport system substrate-binding protein